MLTVGVVLGAALFFLPFFVLKVLVIFVLFGLVFRLFGRHRGHYGGAYRMAFADKIREMDDEEYAAFKERGIYSRCGYRYQKVANQSKSEES